MEAYVKKLAYVEACHKWLRQAGVLYAPSYEDERFFDTFEAFERNYGAFEHVVIESVDVEDFIKELDELLNMTNQMIINEIKHKTHFNGATFSFERLAKALKKYQNVVVAQTISIEGYLTLLLEMRKMGKRLLSKGKIDDALHMASVNEDMEDLTEIIKSLRKAKIKPAESLPFDIPKTTFDSFNELGDKAHCCYTWLRNNHNCAKAWWVVINNV